jgi:uncharacterized repeat protein (TIGR01451 family)
MDSQRPSLPRAGSRSRAVAALAVVAAVAIVPLVRSSVTEAATVGPAKDVASATSVDNRRSDMTLALVSRTFNLSTNNWTIVAEATLNSNRICVPGIFDCIVGERVAPSNASLQSTECLSPLWNHLVVFRDHCLKQVFHAGYDQKFRFTYATTPGVTTGSVTLNAEFGRGVLPYIFQQLATATLNVNLDTALDVTKSCPSTVDSAATVTCTVTVSYPALSGPSLTGVSVTDVPDGTQILASGTLAGSGVWNCLLLTCTAASLSPGESASFTFTGTAATTPTGGDGSNTANLTWDGGGSASATDPVVVVGSNDTVLSVNKTADKTTAVPGGPVSWTVTVTNSGAPGGAAISGTDVVLGDIAPTLVPNLSLAFSSGVGTWTCNGTTCSAATMPVGTATFTASGTVASTATVTQTMVNEVGVTWANDIYGPANPATAGASVSAEVASATTSTTPRSTPARLAFTG